MSLAPINREVTRLMAALRSRYRTIIPVVMPEKRGCRSCGTVDVAKGPYTVSILSRGVDEEKSVAIVTTSTLCSSCGNFGKAHEKILDQAMEVYKKMVSP